MKYLTFKNNDEYIAFLKGKKKFVEPKRAREPKKEVSDEVRTDKADNDTTKSDAPEVE